MNECTYPVALSREEYVRSQTVLAHTVRGRSVNGSRLLSVLMMGLCVLSLGMEYKTTGTVDSGMTVLFVLMVLAELFMFYRLPRQLKRRHEIAYDSARFSGYSFEGIVSVDEHGVSKRTAGETTDLPYAACAAFVETAEWMIFLAQAGKSLVIPARCLTAEDADFTRRMALSHLPKSKQLLVAPLIPGTAERLPEPDLLLQTAEEPLLELDVVLTEREMSESQMENGFENFWFSLSNRFLIYVLISSVLYLWYALPPIPVFLLCGLLGILRTAVFSWLRSKRLIRESEGDVCRIHAAFSDREITVHSQVSGTGMLHLPWPYITRAIERKSAVEFYFFRERLLMIPKRCIDDMEELRRVVDGHLLPKDKEREL